MSLKSVQFTTSHLSYNKGDIAGFPLKTAIELCEVKKVAQPYVPDTVAETGEPKMIAVDEAKEIAERLVSTAKAEVEQKLQEVDGRKAEQDAREKLLNEREADLKAREEVLSKQAAAATAEPVGDVKTDTKPANAKPPKQGNK